MCVFLDIIEEASVTECIVHARIISSCMVYVGLIPQCPHTDCCLPLKRSVGARHGTVLIFFICFGFFAIRNL